MRKFVAKTYLAVATILLLCLAFLIVAFRPIVFIAAMALLLFSIAAGFNALPVLLVVGTIFVLLPVIGLAFVVLCALIVDARSDETHHL